MNHLQALQAGQKIKVVLPDQDYMVVGYAPDKGVYEVEGSRGQEPDLLLASSEDLLGDALVKTVLANNTLERIEGCRLDALAIAAETNSAQKITATSLLLAAKRLAELAKDASESKTRSLQNKVQGRVTAMATVRSYVGWETRRAKQRLSQGNADLGLEVDGENVIEPEDFHTKVAQVEAALEQGHSVAITEKARAVQITLW